MKTILDALDGQAASDDEIFCHFIQAGTQTSITRGDLHREALRYAAWFQANRVQPGEVVLIILRHTPDLFYSFLGAMLVGAIPSFMPYPTGKQDPRLYWSSHQKLFDRIGKGVLFTTGGDRAAIRSHVINSGLRLLDADLARECTAPLASSRPAPTEIAFLQHSSGTTGLKKGVALSHAAVLRQIASYADALGLTTNDRIVSWLPLYHDMGLVACFLLPLVTRTPLIMLDPFEWVVNPSMLFAAIKQHRATLCWQPNFAFHHLRRTVRPSAALDLSSLRAWVDCSEPCRTETFDLFARTFAAAGVTPEKLQVCYAMAETVFAVTQTTPGQVVRSLNVDAEILRAEARIALVARSETSRSVLSTGRPILGLTVQVVDANGLPLADDLVGEITVTGSCLFEGYFKLEEETRRKLRDGWYHTGDLGFVHEGELFVTGRKHDLIIVHGRNYYAHELEYIVNFIPGVRPGRNIAAGWFRPEVGSEEVIIIAEFNPEDGTERPRLVQQIKQTLLAQTGLLVFNVHLVDSGWLVKTTSGKLSRTENLNKYLATLAPVPASVG